AEEIVENLEDTEEKYFLATEYRLLKSRGKLIITEKHKQKEEVFEVSKNGIQNPICLQIQKFDGSVEKVKNKAYFDAEKLVFPLYLRRWKVGDRFLPFGMKGSKKVSELFKDEKLTTLEKENIWILCSGEKIIWVVGLRTSDAHKITAKTQKAITITWKK
ncbi:MAG: tRNA lysidine(34) synthetase TilS, partial [Flavobacteriaceae bacterium]|nr:tRNA lysidine(34) synthetase TilS [Flavobacteriaceae bacterium]